MWCYTCEPPSENTVFHDFDIFPEPTHSATWKTAQQYVQATAGGDAPVWHPEIVPGMLLFSYIDILPLNAQRHEKILRETAVSLTKLHSRQNRWYLDGS